MNEKYIFSYHALCLETLFSCKNEFEKHKTSYEKSERFFFFKFAMSWKVSTLSTIVIEFSLKSNFCFPESKILKTP